MTNETVKTAKLEGFYQLAYAAHQWTSMVPDRRARQIIDGHSEELEDDLIALKDFPDQLERYEAGYIKKFTAWLGAKSRCMSSMVTGPANFPVRKAERANETEHNRSVEFTEWRKKVKAKILRPESTDIVRGTDGAIEKMEAKLEKLEENQEQMKACNKIIRRKAGNEEQKILEIMELGITSEVATKLFHPTHDYYGKGYQTFYLTNNGATIRNLKKDIEAENKRLAKYSEGNKEYMIGDVKVIENVEANRLQLEFDGKPDEDIRKELKSNGFRWSSRFGAWQRQLTENALWAMKRISFLQPDQD